MNDPPTVREEQIMAVVKAVYPLIAMGDLAITVTPGRVVIEQFEPVTEQSAPSVDAGAILGTALGQAFVALTMVNNGRHDRRYFLATEKACRKALDALQEMAASA